MALMSQLKENDYYLTTWKHTKPIVGLLEKCTMQEFDTILELSSESLHSLRESSSSLQFQEILDNKMKDLEFKKQNEIEKIKSEYENLRITELSKKQYEIEQSRRVFENLRVTETSKLQNENSKLQTELEQIKRSFENRRILESTTLQNEIKNLQIQLEQSSRAYQLLNQNYLGIQNANQEQFSNSLNSAVKHVEAQHSKVDSIYKEQISSLQKQLEEYTKNTITQNVSSNKGRIGEQNFDMLVENLTSWSLENTSKIPQSCDRYGNIRNCKTLFEIKNYSHNVPKKEVDKFKRDLEVHKECPLGVFISLNTNIVGGPQDFFYTEFTNSNQLLVYVQQFNSYDASTLFSVIDSLIDIAKLLNAKCNVSEDNVSIQNKVDSIKPILQMEITSISNIIKEINNNTKNLINTVQQNNSSLKHHLEKIQFTFKSILQTFFEDIIIDDSCNDDELLNAKKKRARGKTQSNQILIDASVTTS